MNPYTLRSREINSILFWIRVKELIYSFWSQPYPTHTPALMVDKPSKGC